MQLLTILATLTTALALATATPAAKVNKPTAIVNTAGSKSSSRPIDPALVRKVMTGKHARDDTKYILDHKLANCQGDLCNQNAGNPSPKSFGFYECSDVNWLAQCTWTGPLKDGECHKSTYGAPASMGPDPGLKCTVYKNPTCDGPGFYPLENPGIPNFTNDIWWQANSCSDQANCRDAPQSWKCSKA